MQHQFRKDQPFLTLVEPKRTVRAVPAGSVRNNGNPCKNTFIFLIACLYFVILILWLNGVQLVPEYEQKVKNIDNFFNEKVGNDNANFNNDNANFNISTFHPA